MLLLCSNPLNNCFLALSLCFVLLWQLYFCTLCELNENKNNFLLLLACSSLFSTLRLWHNFEYVFICECSRISMYSPKFTHQHICVVECVSGAIVVVCHYISIRYEKWSVLLLLSTSHPPSSIFMLTFYIHWIFQAFIFIKHIWLDESKKRRRDRKKERVSEMGRMESNCVCDLLFKEMHR